MDTVDHVLYVRQFLPPYLRRQWQMVLGYVALAILWPLPHPPTARENHKFWSYAERFHSKSMKDAVFKWILWTKHKNHSLQTCLLNSWISSGVMVSALAMTGMMLTLSQRRCMNSTSSGFSPWPDGAIKYKHVWTRLSDKAFRWTRDSAVRYSSYFDSTNSMIGTQLRENGKMSEITLF